MLGSNISDEHKEVINSLHRRLEIRKQTENDYQGKITHSSLDTYDDQVELMKHYVCSCGNTMHTIDERHQAQKNSIIGEHVMKCDSCNADEKVKFKMVREALNSLNNKKSVKFPYI